MNSDLFRAVASRRSAKPKYLTTPAPSPEDLASAARAALRAPDHDALTPYRFVFIPEAKRPRLGDLFAAAAGRHTVNEEKIAKARSKALKGPAIVALVFSPRTTVDVSLTEQLLTTGAALDQFLLALKALGYGGIVLSGSMLEDPDVQAAFTQTANEKVLAWITCGTLKPEAPQAEEETRKGPLSVWQA